jgi:hypothetical protein
MSSLRIHRGQSVLSGAGWFQPIRGGMQMAAETNHTMKIMMAARFGVLCLE